MHPTGTATVRCLLFINQGEQREASRFLALAKELGKEGEGRVQLRIQGSPTDFSGLFSHFQKDLSVLKKIH